MTNNETGIEKRAPNPLDELREADANLVRTKIDLANALGAYAASKTARRKAYRGALTEQRIRFSGDAHVIYYDGPLEIDRVSREGFTNTPARVLAVFSHSTSETNPEQLILVDAVLEDTPQETIVHFALEKVEWELLPIETSAEISQ